MKAVVIGGVSIDTIIKVSASLFNVKEDTSLWADSTYTSLGGTGAGKALALAAQGVEVHLFTQYDPADSEFIESNLLNEHITIYNTPSSTTTHTNIMHGNGHRLSVFTSMTEDKKMIHEAFEKVTKEADLIFLNIDQFCKAYIPYLYKNKPIVVDLHDYDPPNPYHTPFLDIATHVFASGIHIDNQSFIQDLIKHKEIVVVTKGDKGYEAINREGICIDEPALELDMKLYEDSNGAGDSFCACTMVHLLLGKSFRVALNEGARCGRDACMSRMLYPIK
jgi:sugar/nucleoside kinase (ribokinase family)